MTDILEQVFYAGQVAQATADNVIGTATATPHTSTLGHRGRLTLRGFTANYSVNVAVVKTVTITYTDNDDAAITLIFDWDHTLGAHYLQFPNAIACKPGTVATAALAASGTGGTNGRIKLFYAES